MGATYTNVMLKGPTQEQVGDFLDGGNTVAYVTPTDSDITVVYDQASSDSDEAALTALAGKLSRSLGCVALASSVYDSDILQYHLYLSGVLADEYDSRPDYWADEADETASAGRVWSAWASRSGATGTATSWPPPWSRCRGAASGALLVLAFLSCAKAYGPSEYVLDWNPGL